MNRSILHLDLDSFFVSVERLQNTELVGKPVLIGGLSERGVVASCSYEARQFGVHAAMPMKLAKHLCPEATVIKGDMDNYSKYSKQVTEVVHEQVPLYEKASIDEFYADLTGMDRFFGCYQLSKALRQKIIKETGLPVSFGLSVNKLVSKVSTNEAKPNGERQIDEGMEKQFLAPLSISKIPMIGKKTYQKLCYMGVRKVEILSQIPTELLEREFGKYGIGLWKKANAIDNSPVVPYTEKKSISTERTFSVDTTNVAQLNAILVGMTEKLAYDLRKSRKLTACVTVKIRYSDFNTFSQQQQISYTNTDHALINIVQELFKKLYNRRLLIRLVGVKFSHLVPGSYQTNLFEDSDKLISLYQAIDILKNRYGNQIISRAVTLNPKGHVPKLPHIL